ncbi:S-adenosyl-L-methionine-dependent methyltransferase [Chytriomyces sp. MP71]|nr:S-adenosyl-L-methionine-dependent methyltransferase [Chytriomyces sp. MP71]
MAPTSHPNIVDGWFRETIALWPGQAMSLQVAEILHHEKSLFQDVLVFKSTNHGNVLVLDGVIQATEWDEFAYQEMIAHVPIMAHPDPKEILVIGGGDGGVLREIVKHAEVERVILVEIDEAVPRVSKLYLPHMAQGFAHPKVTTVIGDGFEYLKSNEGRFDVIITDSSDPVGPADVLFGEGFYALMKRSLKQGGIVCTQGECQWLHLPLIKQVLESSRQIYPTVEYAWASVPTYPCGNMGFILCCNEAGRDLKTPLRTFKPEKDTTRYYSAEVHRAAFVLPVFTRKGLGLPFV